MTTKIPRLFELMEKNNLKQKQLSQATGITEGNISDWKSGKSKPAADKLIAIADYFDVSIDYLLGRTDNPNMYITTGDINNSQIDNSMNVNSSVPVPQDSTTQQFMQIFEELPFEDKIKIMSSAIELKKKRS